jgi:hypothetical protein
MYQLNWVSTLLLFLYWKKIDVIFVKLFFFSSVDRLLAALVVTGIVCLMIAIFIGENLIILNLLNQGLLRNGLILSFQKEFFWKISKPCWKIFCHLLTDDERWFWFTVDSCFPMSYDGLVYYPVFKCWPRSSDLFNRINLTQLLCHEDYIYNTY